jgi:hypothetical protein
VADGLKRQRGPDVVWLVVILLVTGPPDREAALTFRSLSFPFLPFDF